MHEFLHNRVTTFTMVVLFCQLNLVPATNADKAPWYLRYFDDYERPDNGWIEESQLKNQTVVVDSNNVSDQSYLNMDENVEKIFVFDKIVIVKDDPGEMDPPDLEIVELVTDEMFVEEYLKGNLTANESFEQSIARETFVEDISVKENSTQDIIVENSKKGTGPEQNYSKETTTKENVSDEETIEDITFQGNSKYVITTENTNVTEMEISTHLTENNEIQKAEKENGENQNISNDYLNNAMQNRERRSADVYEDSAIKSPMISRHTKRQYDTEDTKVAPHKLRTNLTNVELEAWKVRNRMTFLSDEDLLTLDNFKTDVENILRILPSSSRFYAPILDKYEHLYGRYNPLVTVQPLVTAVKNISLVDETIVKLWLYGGTPLIAGGVIGNILVVIVLCRNNKVCSQAACLVLVLVAIADMLVLLLDLLHRIVKAARDYDFRLVSHVACQFHTFVVHSIQQYVPGLVVLVNIERTVATIYPYGSNPIEAQYIAVAAVGLLLVITAGNVVFFQTHDIFWLVNTDTFDRRLTCNAIVYRGFLYNIWKWLENSLMSFVPISLIVIANAIVLAHVGHKCYTRTSSKLPDITKMVIVVSSFFVVATIPWMCFSVGENQWLMSTDKQKVHIMWVIVNLMSYTQNAVRLLLYALVSGRFRKQVSESFKARKIHPSSTPMTRSQVHENTNHIELLSV